MHGKPAHSQSERSVKMVNQDIENIITAWMQDSITSNCNCVSEICLFCIKPGIPLRCLPEGQNEVLVGTAPTVCISTTFL